MNISYSSGGWQPIVSNVLRIQVAQRDHVARLYGKKPNFSDLLENFIINGIGIKDIVLVVATSSSLTEFHNRLEMSIFEEEDLTLHDMYIPLRSEEHTSELQSRPHLVCRLLLEKKKKKKKNNTNNK